jgi:hypothetical protein
MVWRLSERHHKYKILKRFKKNNAIQNKMKRVWLIGAVLLTIFLVACTKDTPTKVDSVFEGGTVGITAEFGPFGVEEAGTFTIFDTENFPIEVIIQNRGEHDVQAGDVKVTLTGINLADFTGIIAASLSNDQEIEGLSDFNDEGEEDTIDFTPGTDAEYIPEVTGFYQPEIFADVDYTYRTRVIIPEVCFKEDLQDDRICDAEGSKDVFVSSAPVTVTGVTQNVAGRGIVVLEINVQNAGKGKVTTPGSDFGRLFNKVAFKMEKNPQDWECSSSGSKTEAKFSSGTTTIRCKLVEALEKDTLYTKQVELTLDYTYQTRISQSIKILESVE